MDALSQALAAVRMTGAIFFEVDCRAPWGFTVPPAHVAAHLLSPGTERLVNFHLVTEGHAWVALDDAAPMRVDAGDVVVLPHGDPHRVSRGTPLQFVDGSAPLRDALGGQPRRIRMGGDGDATTIVCGFFGCTRLAERLFLGGLPRVFTVRLTDGARGQWLLDTVGQLVDEATAQRPGAAVLLSRMAEVLFVEALRRYMDALPPEQTGWLAAARDPIVGRALACVHADARRPWTVDALTAEVGTSRSVLTDRFARLLDVSPMAYLGRWRMHLAAQALEASDKPVLEIAMEVGYESEAAFNRAFKRELGEPPARWRRARGR